MSLFCTVTYYRLFPDDILIVGLLFVALLEEGQLDDGKGRLHSKKSAMWHLLLWSVLSYKPAMTQFFVLHTATPLGRTTILIVNSEKNMNKNINFVPIFIWT